MSKDQIICIKPTSPHFVSDCLWFRNACWNYSARITFNIIFSLGMLYVILMFSQVKEKDLRDNINKILGKDKNESSSGSQEQVEEKQGENTRDTIGSVGTSATGYV